MKIQSESTIQRTGPGKSAAGRKITPAPRPFKQSGLLFITLAALLSSAFPVGAQQAGKPFGLSDVERMAEKLAGQPFQVAADEVPDFLLNLSYDQYRDIRFKTEKSLWRDEDLPFEVQFFHPGLYYNRLVSIHIVDETGVHPYPYTTELFDFGSNDFSDKIPQKIGFAGFRLHYPLNRSDYRDEVAVFLGASYFRAVAKDLVYGLSARGVAVDTGLEYGEEFPYFKSFWLEKPEAGANAMTVYALLDSESLTGAYRFVIEPGTATQMDVSMTLYARKPVKKLGLAALTSMFFYGEGVNKPPVDDFRPEIHDSDGLLLAYPSGEYVWRPLVNYNTLFINAFVVSNIKGFGLTQRDLDFDHYQDLEARYDKRPSTWVTPIGEWGAGRVELIQIPTDSEKHDNIVALWVPEQPLEPGQPRQYQYRMNWYAADQTHQHALGYVAATRTAATGKDNQRKVIIDFVGGRLADLPTVLPAESPLEPVITLQGEGRIVERQLYPNKPAGGWRMVFTVERSARSTLEKMMPPNGRGDPVEIRAYIRQAGEVLTESWSYAIRF